MAGNLSLNISWFPPFSLPGVGTSYAIWVDGNATAFVAGLTYYTYRYTGTSPCLNHRITVVARNAAGDSDCTSRHRYAPRWEPVEILAIAEVM